MGQKEIAINRDELFYVTGNFESAARKIRSTAYDFPQWETKTRIMQEYKIMLLQSLEVLERYRAMLVEDSIRLDEIREIYEEADQCLAADISKQSKSEWGK